MLRVAVAILAALAVSAPSLADDKPKGKRPKLKLRSSPRHGFAPLDVLFTVELKGGDDLELYYCPEVEWEWSDGGKSVREGDCDPFEPGMKIERRHTARHRFQFAGSYRVKVRLLKAGRKFAQTSMKLRVRPGLEQPYD